MPIYQQCSCGATIRLPESAIGRRARCKTCGTVFTVEQMAAAKPRTLLTLDAREEESPAWLRDLTSGDDSDGAPKPAPHDRFRRPADAPVCSEAVPEELTTGATSLVSFLNAVGAAFIFFRSPGNATTLFTIALTPLLVGLIPFYGWLIGLIVMLYVYAFFMSTIAETARGEDELPTIWLHNLIDDLLMPFLHFVGSLVCVLIPAGAAAALMWYLTGSIRWDVTVALGVMGMLFWPVVVLGVSIGNGFSGLWPHTILRTAASAPLAYAVVCAAVLVAFGLTLLPEAPFMAGTMSRFSQEHPFTLEVLLAILNTYAAIVAMKVVGLFYRHYKDRFPWAAE